ncbi:hypothetical protein BDZ85DRAFT_256767 [Elsinoe ampelina]|uniref:Uncharacterized protein n=1 Tax=Elsinoe ampelina TaxID=302913 RepID=A0A6A6GMR1_9PEZI|nr:hypothetical protein BDZ85DRAFT_256767 [Elsinoe ampelina]
MSSLDQRPCQPHRAAEREKGLDLIIIVAFACWFETAAARRPVLPLWWAPCMSGLLYDGRSIEEEDCTRVQRSQGIDTE